MLDVIVLALLHFLFFLLLSPPFWRHPPQKFRYALIARRALRLVERRTEIAKLEFSEAAHCSPLHELKARRHQLDVAAID
jgi:hypothetical protein